MNRPADRPRERVSTVRGTSRTQSSRMSEASTIIAARDGLSSSDEESLLQVIRLITSPLLYRM